MSNTLGKRYVCEGCGTEALCNKAGAGSIQCCGAEMKRTPPVFLAMP
mgnify:CR=1 FL=1